MFGRNVFRVIASLALVALLVIIGIGVYDAGMSQGIAEAGRQVVASGEPVTQYVYPGPYAGHWGWGFGFFGIFFWILGIFLIFALLRAIFGWGRWRGSGYGGYAGYGRYAGWGPPGGPGGRFEEWHRQAHEAQTESAPGQAEGQPKADETRS